MSTQVEKWDYVEIELQAQTLRNPFLDIMPSAACASPAFTMAPRSIKSASCRTAKARGALSPIAI